MDTVITLEDCNRELAIVVKIDSPIIAPQVKRLLMDRAKKLAFEYSGEKKAFVEREKVPA